MHAACQSSPATRRCPAPCEILRRNAASKAGGLGSPNRHAVISIAGFTNDASNGGARRCLSGRPQHLRSQRQRADRREHRLQLHQSAANASGLLDGRGQHGRR